MREPTLNTPTHRRLQPLARPLSRPHGRPRFEASATLSAVGEGQVDSEKSAIHFCPSRETLPGNSSFMNCSGAPPAK